MNWFLNPRPRTDPSVRMVCLPYAGAGAAAYRTWGLGLPEEIEVLAVQLPGKGWRIGEPPLTDLNRMADQVAEAVLAETSGPLSVFGHSMGAWLGLEVVRRLESAGVRPKCLFASGRQAPAIGNCRPSITHLDDDAFVATVDQRYGGIPPEILANPEVLELVLPALRADFVALERFQPVVDDPVETPIVAMCGDDDPIVPVDHLPPWTEATKGPFDMHVFPGGHFYFSPDPEPLYRKLSMTLLDSSGTPTAGAERVERRP